MKKLLFSLTVVALSWSSSVRAQENQSAAPAKPDPIMTATRDWQNSVSSSTTENGREYIRRRAQEKTAARNARIEGMRWLGHSPARPVVSTTPFMSNPPMWSSVYPRSSVGVWGRSAAYHGW